MFQASHSSSPAALRCDSQHCALDVISWPPSRNCVENVGEKTRNQINHQKMDKKQMKCFFCNSEIKSITVGNFDFRWEGDLYVIKSVPAGLCVQCGEKYISAEASRKIVAIIEKNDLIEKGEVLVFEYQE